MAIHMAHPSVRMKGTEIEWTPLQCVDSVCLHSLKGPHFHCPFCVQDIPFTDQLILKAHYRVKHVDKAIEFAGLKILRCCRSCVVNGIIHEHKQFKGAHWHCYHCSNGFNRRDEAFKHFKQHFRNPQTTLQIVIAQDVNQTLTTYPDTVPTSTDLVTHLVVPQTQQLVGPDTVPGYEHLGKEHVQYQHLSAGQNVEETVVLIELPNDSASEDLDVVDTGHIEENNADLALALQEKERLEKVLNEERSKWAMAEQKMKGTIERLRAKVEYLSNTNASLKHQLNLLHTSSLKRLTHDTDHQSILDELIKHISEDHTQLLHHHLAQLRLYAEVHQLSRKTEEETTSKPEPGLVLDLGNQSQSIAGIAMMSSESERPFEYTEQTVVMTINSKGVAEPLIDGRENQTYSSDPNSLSLDEGNQMSSSPDANAPFHLDSSELSLKSNTSESRPTNQRNGRKSPRGATDKDFVRHNGLNLVLPKRTSRLFCSGGLSKRRCDDNVESETPTKKQGRIVFPS